VYQRRSAARQLYDARRQRRAALPLAATGYGRERVSWWSWQSGERHGLGAIAPPESGRHRLVAPTYPLLRSGSKGDVVVWAQEH